MQLSFAPSLLHPTRPLRWPVRLLIPVAFSLIALQGVSEIIKRVGYLKGLVPASEFEKREHAS